MINETEQNNKDKDMEEGTRTADLDTSAIDSEGIKRKWETIIGEEKLQSLQKGSAVLKEQCEREIKRADGLINALEDNMEHSEDQFHTAVSSNLQILDDLIDGFDDQLLKLENHFQANLQSLRNEYSKERKIIIDKHTQKKEMLLEQMETEEKKYNENWKEQKRIEEKSIDELKNKGIENINNLRFALDSKIEELEHQFELAQNNFLDETSDKVKSAKVLKIKSEQMKRELDALQRKIDRLQLSKNKVKMNAEQDELESKDKNRQLKERKASALVSYQDTKRKMETFRNFQKDKLKETVLHAHQYKEDTQKKLQLAERILKLASLARKLESKEEKNFLVTWEQQNNHENIHKLESKVKPTNIPTDTLKLSEKYKIDLNTHHDTLEKVWGKFSKVLLDVEQIEREENLLLEENKKLKKRLKRFEDGISVNDDVLKSVNPLMIINGRLQEKETPDRRMNRKMTVVDANHAFATLHAR